MNDVEHVILYLFQRPVRCSLIITRNILNQQTKKSHF